MKKTMIIVLALCGALTSFCKPQLSLEAYVDEFASLGVEEVRELGPFIETDRAIPFVKCSDHVLFVGFRPANLVSKSDQPRPFPNPLGPAGRGSVVHSPATSDMTQIIDSVANALPQIVATLSSRYHVAVIPVSTVGKERQISSHTTGYVITLEPRLKRSPFPSEILSENRK